MAKKKVTSGARGGTVGGAAKRATKSAKKQPKSKQTALKLASWDVDCTREPAFAAQEFAFDAMEAAGNGDLDLAVELALRALQIDPKCVDARMLLAEIDPQDDESQLAELEEIVACGEESLGKRFFKENAGIFWGLIETRPYMRARAALAELLIEMHRYDEAVSHYWEMLRLNPNDNQGLRYVLVGVLLETRDFAGLANLLEMYPDEWSPMFKWAKVLERLLADDLTGAEKALPEARKCNAHVEKYLIGKKRMPKSSPGYYSPGKESEAIVCMIEIGRAWKSAPAAVKWLKEQITAKPK